MQHLYSVAVNMEVNNLKTKNIVIKRIKSEQIEAIEKLFQENNWNLELSISNEGINSYECETDVAKSEYVILPIEKETRCPHCFCQPCITNDQNRQQWWGQGPHEPQIQNSGKRKNCYRRFWTMMAHRRVWDIEEYQQKRQNDLLLHRDECVIVFREIMPDCVLEIVRKWYPNPVHVPYMGHKWN